MADGLRRGQFVVIAQQGGYGKPRPALIVQSDLFSELGSVLVCPTTSTILEGADLFRLTIHPTPENGLRRVSQLAVDKLTPVARLKVGQIIGQADAILMERIERAMALVLGIT